LGVAPVGVDDGFEVVLGEGVAIGLRIKARVSSEGAAGQVEADARRKLRQISQAVRQEQRVLDVDGFDRERPQDKAGILDNR